MGEQNTLMKIPAMSPKSPSRIQSQKSAALLMPYKSILVYSMYLVVYNTRLMSSGMHCYNQLPSSKAIFEPLKFQVPPIWVLIFVTVCTFLPVIFLLRILLCSLGQILISSTHPKSASCVRVNAVQWGYAIASKTSSLSIFTCFTRVYQG